MSSPGNGRVELEQVLGAAHGAAIQWLRGVDHAPVKARDRGPLPSSTLPATGVGAPEAIRDLVRWAEARATGSTGPRYFHYVVGGVTPAALAADWITSALDQVATSVQGSPLAVDLEELATSWLVELFHLGDPGQWTGQFTTGATMASFVGLGAARQWWGEEHGVDVGEEGLGGLPRVPVLSSGFLHASVSKSLAMLGLGRSVAEIFEQDNRGTLDLGLLEGRLAKLGERGPAIVVATAGEVNAGGFDPIAPMADLCQKYGAWLHVDGAFGLFARASERHRHLCAGAERADSIAVDAHKWLNVPYDTGAAFVKQRALLAKTFRMRASYLPKAAGGPGALRRRVPANLGPESSRRARALPVFATLLASGADGVASMVEKHLDLAAYLARRIEALPEFELLERPSLNVVPFRYAPPSARKRDLDELNAELGRRLLEDGTVSVGTTRYRGQLCLRPAICNWRTEEADIDVLMDAVEKHVPPVA